MNMPSVDSVPRSRLWLWRVWLLIGIGVLCVGVAYCLKAFGQGLELIAATALLVFILRRPVLWFQRQGLSRRVSTIVVYLIFIALIALIFMILIPSLANQSNALIQAIPVYLGTLSEWMGNLVSQYQDLFETYNIEGLYLSIQEGLVERLSSIAQLSATGLLSAGGSIAGGVLIGVLSLLASFWILIDLPALSREMRVLAGPKREHDMHIIASLVARVFDGYIRGTLLVAFFIAILASVVFWIIGLPAPVLLGFILGVLRIIPYIGPIVGIASVTLLALLSKGVAVAVAVLIISIVIVESGGLFILPKIMSSEVELHPAIILIAIIVGGAIAGAAGMVFATPVMAAAKAVFVYYFENKTGRELIAEDGLLFQGDPHMRLSHLAESEVDEVIENHEDPLAVATRNLKKKFAAPIETQGIGSFFGTSWYPETEYQKAARRSADAGSAESARPSIEDEAIAEDAVATAVEEVVAQGAVEAADASAAEAVSASLAVDAPPTEELDA